MTKHTWRIFCDDLVQESTSVTLVDDEHHYLAHILRLQNNAELEIGNGKGLCAKAIVKEIKKKSTLCHVNKVENYLEPSFRVELYIAAPKNQALSDALRNVAELGVSKVTFFSPMASFNKKTPLVERLERICQEALRVSKNPWLTQAVGPEEGTLPELLLPAPTGVVTFWCDELIDRKTVTSHLLSNQLFITSQDTRIHTVQIVIGNESGFTQEERTFLQKRPQTQACSLGHLILTVPVAATCAASLAMNIFAHPKMTFNSL